MTDLYLSDEPADLAGYLRARPERTPLPSLVRATVPSVSGPAEVTPIRIPGAYPVKWLTDPLEAVSLSAASWTLHAWGQEEAGAHAGMKLTVYPWTTQQGATPVVTATSGELATSTRDVALTTGAASPTSLVQGNRLVVALTLADAGGVMASGKVLTLSYNGLFPLAEGDTWLRCPDQLHLAEQLPPEDILAMRRLLRDAGGEEQMVTDDNLSDSLAMAINTYSRDRPRITGQFYSGNGLDYKFPVPGDWQDGVSLILDIEYPVGQQQRELLSKKATAYEIVESRLGMQPVRWIWLREYVPVAGTDNMLVRYTTGHRHSTSLSTIPPQHRQALQALGASFAATTISAKFAATADPVYAMDAINYRDMTARWQSIAKGYAALYDNLVRGGDVDMPPVSMTNDWDTNFSFGQDRLFHRRRWR